MSTTTHGDRIRSSAYWAALGDSVGFISELVDEKGLSRRTKGRKLDGPLAWSRRVGGRYGPTMEMQAGTYSDDTQLRLATCRAITPNGFDIEAFARIEIPVWLNYALGGGRASKNAARGLTRSSSSWFSNTYDGWTQSGGNGAAMRIQPHVWAAANPFSNRSWIADAMANSISTHAHPRAVLGAVFHAQCVAWAIDQGAPGVDAWDDILFAAAGAPDSFEGLPEIAEFWLPNYDRAAATEGHPTFFEAWAATVDELYDLISTVRPLLTRLSSRRDSQSYGDLVRALDLRNPATRGSGTTTSVAAAALAFAIPDDPLSAVLLACNALGTDTDTIATMTGAISGAMNPRPRDTCSAPVQDRSYIEFEAVRCSEIALGRPAHVFRYPDLQKWKAPKSSLDFGGTLNGRPALMGLGELEVRSASADAGKGDVYVWCDLTFGQSILVHSRAQPTELAHETVPSYSDWYSSELPIPSANTTTTKRVLEQKDKADDDIESMLKWVERNSFDDRSVGYAFKRFIGLEPAATRESALQRLRAAGEAFQSSQE